MSDTILVDLKDGVQTVRFNRPDKKNALTDAMYGTAADALERANESDDIAVTVFFGSGGTFTAGNDIGDFLSIAQGGSQGQGVIRLLTNLAHSKKCMIAAVDGPAVGVGTTMLMHCDMVYATPEARFKTPFVDLGLVPEAGSSLIAPRMMGHARAFELLCMGESFSAKQAHEAGLVNHIVDGDALEDNALAAAQKLADKPPEALAISRALLKGDPDAILERQRKEGELFEGRFASAEAREAFTAFMEKRPADFKKLRQG